MNCTVCSKSMQPFYHRRPERVCSEGGLTIHGQSGTVGKQAEAQRVHTSRSWWGLFFLAAPFLSLPRARAQDIFEIQVYEYKTVEKGRYNLEVHFNNITRGTRQFEGRFAPTDNQFHLSLELTRGITDHFELAGYLLQAQRPGGGYEYAGARVRPRVRAPESWRLPVDVSLSFEVGFPRPEYDPNSVTLEIRPIIEKTFRHSRLSLNPVVGRAWRGPDTGEGFDFEPGAKYAWFLKKDRLNIGMEYYGSTGPITGFSALGEQVHILVPSADVFFTKDLMLNLGVGVGLTSAGERLILKSRVGWRF